ncbi:hypothetical protein L2E82_22793 [Cichorium intybus]|uniref:Uncharacterized protein n=1 Tax=Cichorium intybus TaxID=13427 RepID=A0ACB9DYR3_CICIN|nr:hypothetical protein L2E82_22793 [Cichorium intybus]
MSSAIDEVLEGMAVNGSHEDKNVIPITTTDTDLAAATTNAPVNSLERGITKTISLHDHKNQNPPPSFVCVYYLIAQYSVVAHPSRSCSVYTKKLAFQSVIKLLNNIQLQDMLTVSCAFMIFAFEDCFSQENINNSFRTPPMPPILSVASSSRSNLTSESPLLEGLSSQAI